MNELIEHLAERATKEMDQEAFSEDMNIPAEWYHKFAELIVRDCIEAIQNESMNSYDDWERGLRIAEGAIEKHFWS